MNAPNAKKEAKFQKLMLADRELAVFKIRCRADALVRDIRNHIFFEEMKPLPTMSKDRALQVRPMRPDDMNRPYRRSTMFTPGTKAGQLDGEFYKFDRPFEEEDVPPADRMDCHT